MSVHSVIGIKLRVPVSSLPDGSDLLSYYVSESDVVDGVASADFTDDSGGYLHHAVAELLDWFGADDLRSLADVPGLFLDWAYRSDDPEPFGFAIRVEGGKIEADVASLVWERQPLEDAIRSVGL